jgi:rubredoxin
MEPGSRRYRCRFCTHLYYEALGDPKNGIAPGTHFEDLPDDWVCPECGAGKGDFERVVR